MSAPTRDDLLPSNTRRLRRNENERVRYAQMNAAIREKRRLTHATSAPAVNARRRLTHATSAPAVNAQRRSTHATNAPAVNARRRAHYWKGTQGSRRDSLLAGRRANRRDSVLIGRKYLLDSAVMRDVEGPIWNHEGVLAQRQKDLHAARQKMGVTIMDADPCQYCGAKLFAKEARGICCKNGKFVLPRLPPLPQGMEQLYNSTDGRAQKFRKESRAYNCRCNFASLNVEDGELKKMWGDHILSVQGRTYHSTRKADHNNVQWFLHDPNYTYDQHLDQSVMETLRR